MRQNAKVTIIYSAENQPFRLYLSGYGNPEAVRQLLINAMRGQRRYVKQDPERLVSNFTYQALRQTLVHFNKRDSSYLWRYRIDLTSDIPTVNIKNPSNGISETPSLFAWVGYERNRITPDPPSKQPVRYGKPRRGRPAAISKDERLRGMFVPAPDEIDPVTHQPVFNNNRARRKP